MVFKKWHQSERRQSSVRLRNGRSVPFDVITRLEAEVNKRLTSPPSYETSTREIDFVQFPDGALADLVRDTSRGLCFVVLRDGKITFHRSLRHGALTLVPPRVHRSILESVCLPTTVGASSTAAELLKELNQVLGDYVGLDPPDRKLAAYVTLSSWVSDLLHVVPYLWIIGPPEYGKTTLVRLLSVLCRRGILAADISSAGLYSVIDSLRPTILIDDFEYAVDSRTRDLLRLLRNGSTAGLRVYRATRAYQLFGPKIISSGRRRLMQH
jgi:hypothetical protein